MKKLLPVLFLVSFISCETDSDTELYPTEANVQDGFEEENFSKEIAEVIDLSDYGYPFKAGKLNDSTYLYQGDILIPLSEPVKVYESLNEVPQNKGVARTTGLWENGVVYYQFDPSLTSYAKSDAIKAMEHWEQNTSVTFVEDVSSKGYIYFINGHGCSSYIGRTGHKQNITLGPTRCGVGSTIHEIGHALGYWHEQSRIDRDKWVKILWENIQDGMEYNFYVTDRYSGLPTSTFTTSLDFSSIMLYSSWSFSKNYPEPTITKLNGETFVANRSGLSQGDIQTANQLYPSKEPEKPTYENGKYYVIDGITVLRWNELWYYYHRVKGWKQVINRSGYWYYV